MVNDLTLTTATDAAYYAQEAAKAHREDLAELAEEVRGNNASLTETIVSEGGDALAAAVQKSQEAAVETLRELQASANAQQAQLRALAAQGLADATELSGKLDSIRALAAAAVAAGAENATAAAEELASKHAEALASLEYHITSSNNAISADVKREAEKTRAAMAQSQQKLADASEARRREEIAALDAVIKSGNAAAREAATELKGNMEDLKSLHNMEMSALRDVARNTAALSGKMDKVIITTDETLVHVNQLLEMVQSMKLAAAAVPPAETAAQRKEKLMHALKACDARLKKTESAVLSLYEGSFSDADKLTALKPLHRQVEFLAASLASLAEKTAMLPPDQAPHLAADDLVSAVEKACGEITVHSKAIVVAAVQAPIRFALNMVADAHAECNAALRGASADATGDMPVGWPRELWKHAFGRTIWSGTRSSLLKAVDSYKGPTIELALLEPFAAQKQQDFALGCSDRIDALEWRAMASADAPNVEAEALMRPGGDGKLCGLTSQLALDRLLACAATYAQDDGFRVSVRRRDTSAIPPRGVTVLASTTLAVARMGESVVLEVEATRDCYFYLVEQDSSGTLVPLLPSDLFYKKNPGVKPMLRANVLRVVPSDCDQIVINFSEPPGLERVVCFASLEPWPEFSRLLGVNDDRQQAYAISTLTRSCAMRCATTASNPSVMAVAEIRFTLLP